MYRWSIRTENIRPISNWLNQSVFCVWASRLDLAFNRDSVHVHIRLNTTAPAAVTLSVKLFKFSRVTQRISQDLPEIGHRRYQCDFWRNACEHPLLYRVPKVSSRSKLICRVHGRGPLQAAVFSFSSWEQKMILKAMMARHVGERHIPRPNSCPWSNLMRN